MITEHVLQITRLHTIVRECAARGELAGAVWMDAPPPPPPSYTRYINGTYGHWAFLVGAPVRSNDVREFD